jgi:DNA polymerase-1
MATGKGSKGEERPLLVVDGDNFAHRAYHSMPKSIAAPDGRPINAIVGWTNMILAVWEAEQPRAVYVGWDTLGEPIYRHKLWPQYQAGRVFDRALVQQLDVLPGLVRAFGFGSGRQSGYEADDLMAAAVMAEVARDGSCLVLTSDRDSFQLVSDKVTVLAPTKGIRELARIGPDQVRERFGVEPGQVADFKALAGDASDNIPGARGIGPKTAADLIQRHGDLEALLEATPAGPLRAQAEQLLLFREIVRLQTDVEVSLPATGPPDWAGGAEELRRLGAGNAADRVELNAGRLF